MSSGELSLPAAGAIWPILDRNAVGSQLGSELVGKLVVFRLFRGESCGDLRSDLIRQARLLTDRCPLRFRLFGLALNCQSSAETAQAPPQCPKLFRTTRDVSPDNPASSALLVSPYVALQGRDGVGEYSGRHPWRQQRPAASAPCVAQGDIRSPMHRSRLSEPVEEVIKSVERILSLPPGL